MQGLPFAGLIYQSKDLIQLFSWMCSIPLAMAARSDEEKAASMVYGTTPLGQWYLASISFIGKPCNADPKRLNHHMSGFL